MRLTLTLGLAAALLGAPAAEAQLTKGVFRVSPRLGVMAFDDAASINSAAHLALSTDFALTRNIEVGLTVGTAQPRTRGEDFLVLQRYGDTARVFAVQQSLSMVDYSAQATVHAGEIGPVSAYGVAGAGFYTLFLDPQVSGLSRVTNPQFQLGVGGSVRLGRARVLLDARNVTWTSYDRNRIYPATPADFAYAEDFPRARATRSTINNLLFSIGFSFTPSAIGGDDSNTGDDQ